MMSYIYTYVLCFICSIESSSHWISLSASDLHRDTSGTNVPWYSTHDGEWAKKDRRQEEEKWEDKSTVQSSTMSSRLSTKPAYPTKFDTDFRTTFPEHDEDLFRTKSEVTKVDTQIYQQLPGSDHFIRTDDAVASINRATFTEGIIWKQVYHNETKIQVNLFPAIANSLPNVTRILVDFKPKLKNTSLSNYCGVSNNTCAGPIVEIKAVGINAEQSHSFNDHEIPIVKIKFNKTELNSYYGDGFTFECVYWHEKDEAWKNDGLETDNSDINFLICLSTHLTLFSVLLDPRNVLQSDTVESIPNNHETILTILSVVGSFVTIPCVIITMGSYTYLCKKYILVITNNEALKHRLRRKPNSETTKILIHSCAALLLTHLSFQTYHWFEDRINCRVINFLTHYSVTAFIMWAACDGLNMWRILFNDVFNLTGRYFYQTCFIVSWGFSLLTTTAGVLETNYYGTDKCKLSFNRGYEFALYILPCSIILGSNLLFFVWMVAKFICKKSLERLRDKKVNYIFALANVFNMVWCLTFPLLWFRETRLLGQYLMAVLVSTQGILMLTLRCAKDFKLKLHISVRRANCLSLPSFLKSNSTKTTGDSAPKSSELQHSSEA